MAGTITGLKVQKRNKNRVNVYLDERYNFSLADHLAVPLRRGQFLADEEIARLKEEDEYHQVYKRAVRLIDHRPRSVAEVRRRIEGQGVLPDLVEKVIGQLTAVGLLDDAEFARFQLGSRWILKVNSLNAVVSVEPAR